MSSLADDFVTSPVSPRIQYSEGPALNPDAQRIETAGTASKSMADDFTSDSGSTPVSLAKLPPAAPARNWSDVPLSALKNIPSSAGNFIGGIYQAVRHPVDTVGNVLDMAAGALHNVLPPSVSSAIDKIDPNPEAGQLAVSAADAAGGFFKDRYGSAEGIKNTLATDPVGVAADLSAVLTGGAALTGKIPQAARLAAALRTGAEYTNPLSVVKPVVSQAIPAVGRGVANAIGGLGTHTGGESIQQAARSGFEGGSSAKAFADNLRGNVPMTDVLDAAKANIEAMGREKSAAYRQGMAQVSGDKTILDFGGIDQAVNDAAPIGKYNGQVINQKAAQVQQAIADAVEQWKALPPDQFHTPEGLDALKQQIGGITESIPFEEKTARLAGSKIYNAVKSEIVRQAPVYADTMKAYAEASDQIKEIERALSLGGKASVDTAMRKLQSLTRNNVNTNYSNRLDLAKQLAQQGGNEIMPALSGQALNTWTPRGLGSAVASGIGMGGYALGGAAAAIPAMAVQSPRLMGEAAFKAGQIAKLLKQGSDATLEPLTRAGIDPATLGNALYQVGRLPHQ